MMLNFLSGPTVPKVCFGYLRKAVECRPGSAELRVAVDHKIAQVDEYAFCTCTVFSSLITGSSDYSVRLWNAVRGSNPQQFFERHAGVFMMHGTHGSAALWDLEIEASMSVRYGGMGKVRNLRQWTWCLSMKAQ